MSEWEVVDPSDFTDTKNGKVTYIGEKSSDDWELHEESGQQRLEVPGGTYWLSPDIGDSYSLIKITIDAAGPNPSKPQRFATELRAKDYVEFLCKQSNLEF